MWIEVTQTMMLIVGGAFLLGYVLAKIGGAISRRGKAADRDPRDDRIRSMEADLRVSQTETERLKAELEEREKAVAQAEDKIGEHEEDVLRQTGVIDKLNADLKESIRKTRQLRGELTDRATENIKSEVKLREVETELEVAQASSEMISTGVLDYDESPNKEDTGMRRRKEDNSKKRRKEDKPLSASDIFKLTS